MYDSTKGNSVLEIIFNLKLIQKWVTTNNILNVFDIFKKKKKAFDSINESNNWIILNFAEIPGDLINLFSDKFQ